MRKSIFNWSGGKDSSLALYEIKKDQQFEVSCLLTTINSKYNRISMHGVRKELLYNQVQSLGIPLKKVLLPEFPTMSLYEEKMYTILKKLRSEGITDSIFGDIFLEDLKKYRENKLKEVGLKAHFPLWGRDTKKLMYRFIELGFKSVVVCVDANFLSKDFAGRIIDESFIKGLPDNVDPCGENGEFHTFVYDGPIFTTPIKFKIGKKVHKTYPEPKKLTDRCFSEHNLPESAGFHYCDLIPV
ncbi:diphthine--ammonia ligase [Abyssalbus ytuae]|uniref:Diphthine--ammonia ligase n=1 Tax=Abyssalbus ytuae TaxID=2926907 RepID=A0A9E6ZNG6_9FLAO|nr:diphthine--ammonia ligase [Abyssalbus ytuae]UOB19169.1 diphthine--ammonia ligase [Abyssalbus ytuae]